MASPKVLLKALTPEASAAAGRDEIVIHQLPFRVGRESRLGVVKGGLEIMERRKLDHAPTNDLYLVDAGPELNISREHFQIESDGNGGYVLVDRGSACGTVAGESVINGGDEGGLCPLSHGNVIVVGTPQSPYAFKFLVEPD
jgi:hypothetical protein